MSSKEISIEKGRKVLGDLVTAAQQGTDIVITRNGKPAARLTRYQEPPMFTLHQPAAGAQPLPGDTIIEAIENNFKHIAVALRVGSAAGYRLVEVYAQDDKSWPGVELTIRWTGLALAHKPADGTVHTSVGMIHAPAGTLPERHYFPIGDAQTAA